MVSATDIITYIGVPLAVLGVLPIIYNTVATLATVARVRRMLRHGRLAGITRGDVVNHVIEVELPRYTITPLHREEQCKKYWGLCDYPSQIPGGTWTILNWQSRKSGSSTQRFDYSDQLRIPQAEIGFEELISYLLDLGAVPDAAGFRMLRGSGLWVPTGTPLLVSPDRHEAVLTIAPLDDSEGKLSLAVRWSSNWGMRDPSSLPPYWVLIKGIPPQRPSTSHDDGKAKILEENKRVSTAMETKRASSTSKYVPVPVEPPPAIRCQIGVSGLISAVPDDFDLQMFDYVDVSHLTIGETGSKMVGVWFASAITALGTSSQTILWNYKIPSDVLAFAKKCSIPCGILVLLGIVDESITPEWATKHDDESERREEQMRRMKDTTRAMLTENSLPPEQRAAAVRARQMKEHESWIESNRQARRKETQRQEARMLEAIQSPVWDNKLVAEHNLTWLKKEGHVDETHDLKGTTEILLWKMVTDRKVAEELTKMLNAWKAFIDNGGLRKADFLILKEEQVMFAYSSLLLALIEDSVSAAHGSLALDLQECMRIWKTVRLG